MQAANDAPCSTTGRLAVLAHLCAVAYPLSTTKALKRLILYRNYASITNKQCQSI